MYPLPHRPYGSTGLARYGSAPAGSFLSSLVDSVLAGEDDDFPGVVAGGAAPSMNPFDHGRLFGAGGNSPCLTSESSCRVADLEAVDGGSRREGGSGSLEIGLERSFFGRSDQPFVGGLLRDGSGGSGGAGGSSLIRHSSSPAGFLSNLMVDHNGYSSATESGVGYGRLRPQLSFSSRENSLSQFSDATTPDAGGLAAEIGLSYAASELQFAPWDDGGRDGIVFPGGPANKRVRDSGRTDAHEINSLEMGTVEKLFQLQEDTAACKIRARRGCATHPRSIAERERRTRISEKLKKLQELVPNMDKQTNTSDMLDLAVQHIKSLQGQILKLNEECATCSCKSN